MFVCKVFNTILVNISSQNFLSCKSNEVLSEFSIFGLFLVLQKNKKLGGQQLHRLNHIAGSCRLSLGLMYEIFNHGDQVFSESLVLSDNLETSFFNILHNSLMDLLIRVFLHLLQCLGINKKRYSKHLFAWVAHHIQGAHHTEDRLQLPFGYTPMLVK